MTSLHNRVRQYLKQQAALAERKRQCRLRQMSKLCGGDRQDSRHLGRASSSKRKACSSGGQGFLDQILRTLNGCNASSSAPSSASRRRLPALEIVSGRKRYQPVRGDSVSCILRQRPFAIVRNPPSHSRSVTKNHCQLSKQGCHCDVWQVDAEGEGDGEYSGQGEGDARQPQLRDLYACRCCHCHRLGPLQSVSVTPVSAAQGQHHYSARPVNRHIDDGEACDACARLARDAAAAATSAGRHRNKQERRVVNCQAMLIYQPPPLRCEEDAATIVVVDQRHETEQTVASSEGSPPVVNQQKGCC